MDIKWILSWLGVILITVGIAGYMLYQRGKLPLDKWLAECVVRMPKWFEPKLTDLAGKLDAQTKKEVAKAKELRDVLEAKKELVKAKAENTRLRREIDGISEKSASKKPQEDADKGEKVVKPTRL